MCHLCLKLGINEFNNVSCLAFWIKDGTQPTTPAGIANYNIDDTNT